MKKEEENPTPKSQPMAKSLALPNPNLRASLVPSQSLDSSQSFNLIHPSSLTMGSRVGITFPFFLMCIFQPI